MLWVGRGLVAVGAALMVWALGMDVSIPDPTGTYGALANNDLMNQRLLFATVGAGTFISGWLALILRSLAAMRTQP